MSNKVTGKAFDAKIFNRLLKYALEYKLHFYISVTAAILLSVFAGIRSIIVIDSVDKYIAKKDPDGLLFYTVLLLLFLLGEVLLQLLFIFIANWLGQNVIKDIRTGLFKKLIYFKTSYFHKNAVGKLVTRVVSDVETIAAFFSQGLFMIISDILKMGVVAVIMLYQNWKLALITFLVLPVLIYATKVFQKSIKSSFQEVRNQVSNLNSFIQERVTGMKIVQIFNREKIEYQKFYEINEKHKKAYIKTVWYYSIFFPISEVLTSIAIGLLVWYGGLRAAVDSSITVGEIIGFIMMAQMLFRPLRQIADKFNTLQMGMVAGDRIFEVIDTEETQPDTGTKIAPNFQGKIVFDKVHFSYIEGEEILKGISFEVKAGETVAIVGATGAGKSTIINLINRFYEIDSGTIKVDYHDISEYTMDSLRNQISVVLQDVFLFSDTIYNNIVLGDKTISLKEVQEAAKEIGIHEFIMSLPNNYQYNVKERGVMLSAGQRQLIAFLRAYLSKPSILILDEATSSIDSHSEQLLQKVTKRVTKNQTSIVIAHRLATIQKASRIIVMEQGNIIEQGSHKELLRNQNGHYKMLYDTQFANERPS